MRFRSAPSLMVIAWGVFLVAALFVFDRAAPGGRRVFKIAGLDPVYYFANAHSLLFDHDFDLRNQLLELKPSPDVAMFPGHKGVNGLPGSPWAIGYPILSLPFLAAGTLWDAANGRPPNGYSEAALIGYHLANVFFVALVLFFQMRFLQHYGIPDWRSALISLATWFSTTLIYYTYTPMSHAATFVVAAGFLLAWRRVKDSESAGLWFLLGLCGGLLSICRWQDSAFLAGPVLFEVARRHFPLRKWLAYGAGAVIIWIPQVAQWRIVYGKFLTMPYGPGFAEFPPRHILDVLFSTNHGWFIWTPAALLGIAGLIYSRRSNWPWIVVICIQVAILGALPVFWNCGESFGMRSLTSCTPLLALGIGILFSRATSAGKAALTVAICLCALYTVLFAVQFRLDRIPRTGPLTMSEVFSDKLSLLRSLADGQLGRHLRAPGLPR